MSYIEGCSAPTYSTDSLHSAVVELIALPGDVYFLVAPRTVESEGSQGRGSDTLERDGLTYCVPRVLGLCP